MRNDSSTAFFSHSLTRQVPPCFSATRNVPASSRPSVLSTAARNSADAFCGVIFARDSKPASMAACNSSYAMMLKCGPVKGCGGRSSPGGVAPVERPHQRILHSLTGLLLQDAAFGIGDIEHVFGALAHRHDLGAVDRHPFGAENLADFRQQPRP